MKESKVLKIISYIAIPIIVAIIIISLCANVINENNNKDIRKQNYFQTDEFVSDYMCWLADASSELIYNHENFAKHYDGDIEISYITSNINNIEKSYYLIMYKNLALTNIELTSETSTIDQLKTYIYNNENSKKLSIENGNLIADSDMIQNKGIKYFDRFKINYYTRKDNSEIIEGYEEEIGISNVYEYIDTNIQDFSIYSSYQENIKESEPDELKLFFANFSEYGENIAVIVPFSVLILLLIGIYLILSIGYSKDKEGICLNDIDKIPLEIIGFVFLIVFGICCAIISEADYERDNISLCLSMLLSSFIGLYISCAVVFDTVVKRIKSKTFLKNTIFYKVLYWLRKKAKEIWYNLTKVMPITKKMILIAGIYCIIALFLIIIFQGFGLFLDLIVAGVFFYKIIKEVNYYTEEAFQEKVKSEKLRTELITNVSHDIKTPLTSIINYVDLLKKEKLDNPKVKEYIEVLDNKSQRLKKITEDLIEVSKASSGSLKLNLEDINVVELIKQANGEFEDKFKSQGLEIIMQSSNDKIIINNDSRYMYRIIENIYSNISKYALKNTRVYIDVKENNNKVYMDFKNTSKEKLNISEDELMQRFVRGDKSRTTEGSGLGLAIISSLAEVQNGECKLKIDGDLFKVSLIFNIK